MAHDPGFARAVPPLPDRLDPVQSGPRRNPARLYSPEWFAKRQILNATRYAQGLTPISETEFGEGAARPSAAHIRAANTLLAELQRALDADVAAFAKAGARAAASGHPEAFGTFLKLKDRIYAQSKEAERLLAFYRNIFQQRQGRFGERLAAMDRIALDCYQAFWLGLGAARSVPAPHR